MAALRLYRLHLTFLILAVLGAYANVYGNGFLLDDEFLLQKNRFIRDTDYFWRIFISSSTMGAGGTDSFYRPMQTLAYFIVHQIFGLSPAPFHALNVGLHALNACLVFGLGVARLGMAPIFALSAALIWAVHPLHTEAVTYMSATADPLHTLFILLGLFSLERRGLACAFFVAGLMSKESAIVFPVMAMAVIAVRSSRPFHWRTHVPTWPLWVIAALYLIARKTILDFDDTFNFYNEPNIYTENISYRFLTFLGTLPGYARLLLWPTELHMERDFPVFAGWTWEPRLGAVILLVSAALVFKERRQAVRPWSLMVLWFFAAHIPHTGVLLPVNSLFLEHWMYLPSIGLLLGIFTRLELARVPSRAVLALSAGAALALGAATFRQNRVWADPVTFYENILKYAKGTTRLFNNLGMAYSERGDGERAIETYLRAVAIKDSYPEVRHNIAEELMRRGQYRDAIPHLERALEINPRFYHSMKNLAAIYQRLGDDAKAQYYYNLFQVTRPD